MSTIPSTHIQKHIKVYLMVFAALLVGTVVTVAAANVQVGIAVGITVAVLIALVKSSLVAGYFMHLFSERKLIYGILALTAVFAVAMLALLWFSYGDQQGQTHGIFQVPARQVPPHGAASHPEREGVRHVP